MTDPDLSPEEWNTTLAVTRKKLLKVFLAGAAVATMIWWVVFWIFLELR